MHINVKYKTIQLSEKTEEKNLCDLAVGIKFLEFTPQTGSIKGKT